MFAPEIRVFSDPAALAGAAQKLVVESANAAASQSGRFSMSLAGGSTPAELYSLLGNPACGMPWQNLHLFFGDERSVSPDHPESNYGMARRTWFDHVPIPESQIHRVLSEWDPVRAAEDYEEQLRHTFLLQQGQWPRFDLVLLGIGNDGHTASLFPGTAALTEQNRMVCANPVPQLKTTRITMTYPVFNAAALVIFMVTGKEKAPVLKDILENKESSHPAARIQPSSGKTILLVTQDAI